MLSYDIDSLKQILYTAIDNNDYSAAYVVSTELDVLIVEYYKNFYNYN